MSGYGCNQLYYRWLLRCNKGKRGSQGRQADLAHSAVETDTTGNIGSVKVKVSTTNYHDFTLTVNVSAANKIEPTPDGEITATSITYGNELSMSTITGTMQDPTRVMQSTVHLHGQMAQSSQMQMIAMKPNGRSLRPLGIAQDIR